MRVPPIMIWMATKAPARRRKANPSVREESVRFFPCENLPVIADVRPTGRRKRKAVAMNRNGFSESENCRLSYSGRRHHASPEGIARMIAQVSLSSLRRDENACVRCGRSQPRCPVRHHHQAFPEEDSSSPEVAEIAFVDRRQARRRRTEADGAIRRQFNRRAESAARIARACQRSPPRRTRTEELAITCAQATKCGAQISFFHSGGRSTAARTIWGAALAEFFHRRTNGLQDIPPFAEADRLARPAPTRASLPATFPAPAPSECSPPRKRVPRARPIRSTDAALKMRATMCSPLETMSNFFIKKGSLVWGWLKQSFCYAVWFGRSTRFLRGRGKSG